MPAQEFELRVVESSRVLPRTETQLPAVPPKPSVLTAAETVDALRATNGGESVLAQIPTLANHVLWNETAYLDVNQVTGTGEALLVWDCDILYPYASIFYLKANGLAFFMGAGDPNDPFPPPPVTDIGQVWAIFEAPTDGYYVMILYAQTYVDNTPAGYEAAVDCFIDDAPLGHLPLKIGVDHHHPFVAHLVAGRHQFTMKQALGGVFFWNLTVWSSPVEAPSAGYAGLRT
jgi:hypothetical protein